MNATLLYTAPSFVGLPIIVASGPLSSALLLRGDLENDDPAKSFRPSARLTLTAFTSFEPSLARYPSTLMTSAGFSDVRVQPCLTRLVQPDARAVRHPGVHALPD